MKQRKPSLRVTQGHVARRTMLDGVAELTRVVSVTYGPQGRNVMLDRPGGLLSTKDGVSVAWEVSPEDPVKRLGTRVLQEACAKVNKLCGDGTTTTAILVHAILREGFKYVAAGAHPVLLAQDLQRVAEGLDADDLWDILCPKSVDEVLLREVALTASNGDTSIADALVEAFGRVGSEGMIVVEEGKGRGIELDHKTGMEIERGWESSELAGPGGGLRRLDIPLIVLVDAEMTSMKHVVSILEEATQFPHPLIIVSRGCFGEALKVLVTNDRKLDRADGKKFEVTAVRCPGHVDVMRQHLDDLAALTGATVLDPLVTPFEKFTSEMFGSAQTVTVKKESTVFVAFEDKFPLIEKRVEQLKHERSEFSHDAEEIRTRIAKLTDGFCVMRVGGWSDTEIREKRARVEDALGATRVAVEEGVVPGAGISYLALGNFLEKGIRFSHMVPQFAVSGLGDVILAKALQEPLRVLARNAGHEPSGIVQRVLEASMGPGITHPFPNWETGWDARTNEVRDLSILPIICDPLAVVKAVILTAISTASTLLTAEVALTRVCQKSW